MKKILFLLFFYFSSLIFSQISFISKIDQNINYLNDNIKIDFILTIKNEKINKVYDNIILPNLKEFNILSSSISENTNIVNGKISFNLIYSITLEPKITGNLIIPPAQIKINHKIYKTQVLHLYIKQNKSKKTNKKKYINFNKNNTFVQLEIEKKKTYYLYDSILCQITLYTQNYNLINQIINFQNPIFKNCLIIPIQYNKKIELINKLNNKYFKIILQKFLLYPLETGLITIPKYNIHITGSHLFIPINPIYLSTISQQIQIKKFPKNPPKNFINAVGSFNMKLISNKTKLKTNSINQIILEIKGCGNFKLIKIPNIIIPNNFEIYHDNLYDDYQYTEKGLKGKIYNSKMIIPKYAGSYIIKTDPFVFFNPKTKHYHIIQSQYLNIQVEKNKKNNNILLHQKSKIIKNNNINIKNLNNYNINNFKHIILKITCIILIILIIVILIYYIKKTIYINNQKIKKLITNSIFIKNNIYCDNNLNSIIIKLNSKKIKLLIQKNNQKEYFHEIEKILFNIVKTNNHIITNKIKDKIIQKFGEKQFNLWKKLIIKCQIEKFNPISNNINLNNFHKKITYLLNQFKT